MNNDIKTVLTDELIKELWDRYAPPYMGLNAPTNFTRAIERAVLEAAQQVAQPSAESIGIVRDGGVNWFDQNPHAYPIGTTFYATPPTVDQDGVKQ